MRIDTILNGLAYFYADTKPESVIFGQIKIRFSRNQTFQENLNRSGPAKNQIFGSLHSRIEILIFESNLSQINL